MTSKGCRLQTTQHSIPGAADLQEALLDRKHWDWVLAQGFPPARTGMRQLDSRGKHNSLRRPGDGGPEGGWSLAACLGPAEGSRWKITDLLASRMLLLAQSPEESLKTKPNHTNNRNQQKIPTRKQMERTTTILQMSKRIRTLHKPAFLRGHW